MAQSDSGVATATAYAGGGTGGSADGFVSGAGGDADAQAYAITETGVANAFATAEGGDAGYHGAGATAGMGGAAHATAIAQAGTIIVTKHSDAYNGNAATAEARAYGSLIGPSQTNEGDSATIGDGVTASTYIQSNGTQDFTDTLTIAATTTYDFSGGTINATTLANDGVFDWSGGTISANVTNTGTLEVNAGAGTLTLASGKTLTNSGGTIDVQAGTLNVAGTFRIANGTDLTKTGSGKLTVPYLEVRNLSTATLANGTLETGATYVGTVGPGTFVQTGGTHTTGAGELMLGLNWGAAGSGEYDLGGGTLNTPWMRIGADSGTSGLFSQSGGVLNADTIYVGENGYGELELNGTAQANVSTLSIGFGGTGVLNQSGGTLTVDGALIVRNSNGGTGTYNLSGGTLSMQTMAYVGPLGTGTFNQTGGTHELNGNDLSLGSWWATGGTGVYNLSSGSLHGVNDLVIGAISGGTGEFVQTGGSVSASHVVVARDAGSVGEYDLSGGSLTANTVTNNGLFEWSGGSITANVINNGTLNVRGGGTRTVTGNVVNNGTIKTWSTAFAYTGTFTNNGSYISDPADNFFNDLVVSATGSLIGGAGDRFIVSGALLSSSMQSTAWNTVDAALLFQGGNSHVMSITGEDLGATVSGFSENFAWGSLSLASGESLAFVDGNGEAGGALYLGEFLLADGLAQLPLLQATDVNIYYDPSLSGFLNGAAYQLIGGGWLRPVGFDPLATQSFTVMPEPSALSLALVGTGFLGRRRRRN